MKFFDWFAAAGLGLVWFGVLVIWLRFGLWMLLGR